MTYLERYMQGECLQVWDELRLLQEDVYREPFAKDAYAVAEELMRRVKHNILTLIPRLIQVGYYFGYDWITQSHSREIFSIEAYQNYQNTKMWLNAQPQLFTSAHVREECIQFELDLFGLKLENADFFIELYRGISQTADCLVDLENLIGTVPMSFKAWYDIVGSVNFVGWNPEWYQACQQNDLAYFEIYRPLFVYPLTTHSVEAIRTQLTRAEAVHFSLFPDEHFKHNYEGNGAYYVSLDAKCIDIIVEPLHTFFVDHLRNIIGKGGLGGFDILGKLTNIDIKSVKEGLLLF